MAKKEKALEIEIEEATNKEEPNDVEVVKAEEEKPEETAVEAAPEPEKQPEKRADEAIERLNKQLEDERRARIEAERRAQLAQQEVKRANSEVEDTNLQLINNAIDSVKNDNAFLKQQYRDAMAAGDYDKVAELQESISINSAKLLQLENGKTAMQSKPKVADKPAPVSSDPVEQFASQLSPRSADWIRRNPQCVTDQRLTQKMIAAHNLAIADGYQADSDDYFSFIEDTLKINRAPKAEAASDSESPMSSASTATQRRSAPAAAPVSRSGNGTGTRQNVVRLTDDEREMAKMMGMTDVEYAKNKVALIKEGKLTH